MAISEEKREYNRKYYQENRERLLRAQRAYEDAHKEEKKARDKARYENKRGEIRAQQAAYYQEHREEIDARNYARLRLPENRERSNERNRKCRRKLRLEVLAAYGGVCSCCGEPEEAFLEAHHKNGGGNKHRRELGGGAKFYGWLRRNDFPPEFGLLCSNCNKAEYNRGICPHRLKRLEQKGNVN